MSNTTRPIVTNVKRHAGIAGQFSVTADVTYPDEPTQRAEFVGFVTGPVVAIMPTSGAQVFVTDPGRHGEFGPEWVRRFFA